jgi:hypothetical protein
MLTAKSNRGASPCVYGVFTCTSIYLLFKSLEVLEKRRGAAPHTPVSVLQERIM